MFRKGIALVVMLLFIGMIFTPLTVSNEIEQYSVSTFNDGTLSGYVNNTSMNPIEGTLVRVYFHETYEENYTDSSGYYHVTNIPICYCMKNCTASKEGYKTEWTLLGIDENTTYDFVLTPLPCYPVFFGKLGENNWYVSCVQISFIWSSDVVKIWCQIDDEDWINWSEPFEPICEDGAHTICWKYEDIEGNISDVYCKDFKIDQTPPDIEEVEWETFQEPPIFGIWYVTFTCNATDNISGMDRVEMYINEGLHEVITGAGPIYEFEIEWWCILFLDWVFTFVHYDTAGNFTNDSINDSEITPFPYIKNNHFAFNGWLERFPILQMILDVLRLNIR
ncbi:Carboxypeptidase regulatory-like domain-containing protein [Thermoplasmatales archaeon SCGC AB-540-F20]|nr:Carboxypeptidase regulatory-like domain-containing protein [Thermoplasmatales archaeon SCGC AB-540-F20]